MSMGASDVVTSDEGADPSDEEGDNRKKRKKKKGLVQKIVKTVACCASSPNINSESTEQPYEPRKTVMGPLTLSEFVDTLEPYDPSLHGWRGQEPRRGWKGLPSPKIHPKTDEHQSNRSALV